MDDTMLLLLPAAVLLLASAAVAVARLRRGRGRVSAAPRHSAGSARLQVRELRAEVERLQTRLDEERHGGALEQHDPAAGDVEQHEAAAADDLELYRSRVIAAIEGIGRRVSGDVAAERVLTRVRAAVDRLELTDGFQRPALSPAVPTTLLPAAEGPSPLRSVPAVPEPGVAPAPLVGDPVTTAPESETALASGHADLLTAVAASERVLPVPPLPQPQEDRRASRRFRRAA